MSKEEKHKKFQKMTILLLVALVLCLGGTYAWLALSLQGEKTSDVVVGNLSLKLDDNSEGIYLDNAYPVTDSVGFSYNPYSFSLTNDGNIPSNYIIYLDDEELENGVTRMNEEYVKYSLVRNGVRSSAKFLTTTKTETGRVLDSGILDVGQTNEYDLRLWIADTTENDVMTTTFSGRIRIEAEQIKE